MTGTNPAGDPATITLALSVVGPNGTLPHTGSPSTSLVLVGIGLLTVGALAKSSKRRRRLSRSV